MGSKKREFTELVNQHSAMLFRYAYWLSRDPSIAQDIVQETFTRAWKGYGKLKKKESAKAWLITILRRENARRFERKRLLQVDREVDTFESGYGKIDDRVDALILRQALDEISPDYSEPLILQVLCGYTAKEIAHMLDMTPEAVMTRLYRSRKKLQNILGEKVEDGRSKRP